MNRKSAFSIGLAIGLSLAGSTFYLLSKEAKKLHESVFISGYINQISTLNFILSETGEAAKTEIAISELCDAILIVSGKFEKGVYSSSYVEAVASTSVPEYEKTILDLSDEYCSKNI